jgi:D-alanyl-D-alanine carboxypeptidase
VSSFVVSLLFGCALPASAAPRRHTGCVPRLYALLEEKMDQLGIPGLIVAVDAPGGCHFSAALGEENVAARRRMRLDDKMRIGSVTKTFTGTLVLQLVDEHLIGLDDAIGTYIPSVPNGDAITVRQLLQMRSGLYNYTDDPAFNATQQADPGKVWTTDELLAVAYGHGPTSAPGAEFHYSNTNSVLLGLLVEHVTGHPFERELERRILRPLRLRHTSFPTTPAFPYPHARGYGYATTTGTLRPDPCDAATVGLHDAIELDPSWAFSAGAMISTVRDLRVWSKALVDGTLLKPATHTAQLETLPTSEGSATSYGLHVFNISGFIGHNGSLPGFQSFMGHNPASGATIIVLVNVDPDAGCGEPADDIAATIAQALGLA